LILEKKDPLLIEETLAIAEPIKQAYHWQEEYAKWM
jgi:hypothetical protein